MRNQSEPLAGILAALKKMKEKRSTGIAPCAEETIIKAESNTQPPTRKAQDDEY